MKNSIYTVLLVALAAVLFVSCEDKGGKSKLLDPMAKISIYPAKAAQGAAAKAGENYPTPLEVVQQTTDIAMQSPAYPNEPYVNVGISAEQKDEKKLCIKMWGDWIIRDGVLQMDFIEAYDVVFVTRNWNDHPEIIRDTVAYIPNATLRTAEKAIKAAYAAEDYEQVYSLFDQAYRFTPINGADWRALKAQNKN